MTLMLIFDRCLMLEGFLELLYTVRTTDGLDK